MATEELKTNVFVKDIDNPEIPDHYIEDYEAFCQKDMVISNGLIGFFEDGEYKVAKDIKEEFVKRKKYLKERKEDRLIATLPTKGKNLTFELVFSDYEEKTMIAELYLVEKLHYGKIETFIADYISEKNYEFKQKAREAFNILLEVDEAEKEEAVEGVIERRLAEVKAKKTSDRSFILEMYSEYYVLRMLKLLAKTGPLGLKILEEYKFMSEKLGYNNKALPELYIKLRALLDGIIKENGGIRALINESSEYKVPIKDFMVPVSEMEKIAEKLGGPIVAPKKIEEKKPAEAKKAAPSSSAKKSGGNGGGKDKGGKDKGGSKPKGGKDKKDDKKKPLVADKPIEKVKLKEFAAKKADATKKSPPKSGGIDIDPILVMGAKEADLLIHSDLVTAEKVGAKEVDVQMQSDPVLTKNIEIENVDVQVKTTSITLEDIGANELDTKINETSLDMELNKSLYTELNIDTPKIRPLGREL